MLARTLVDLVMVLHLLFILFALLGGLLLLQHRAWGLVHIPAAVWAVLVEWQGYLCPLTPLEQRLRLAAGEQGYQGGFIDHYLMAIIYPAGLTQNIQLWLGLVALLVNVLIYGWVGYRLSRRRRPGG